MMSHPEDAPRALAGFGIGKTESKSDKRTLPFRLRKGKRERWDLYETRKRELEYKNLSPAEYQAEISRICRGLGL